MSIINSQPRIGAAGQSTGFKIERSLRFNSADSAYLNRTPASDTSGNKKGTFSCWMKVSSNSGTNGGTFLGAADSYHYGQFYNESLYFGNDSYYLNTAAVFRDFSAWYHVVFVFDTTLTTTNDRMIIYVNNVRQTVGGFNVQPNQNVSFKFFNTAQQYEIGRRSLGNYFNGYLTEVNFIDGQALTPSSFGETDTDTGVWKPKAYSGSYGTNGFYLKFADNSGTTSTTLGKDSSGNGNNWTPNNFSVTAGAGNDSLVDTPTPYGTDTGAGGEVRGNYCTLNPLNNAATSLVNGNLDSGTASGVANWLPTSGTIGVSSGKWYWEVRMNSAEYLQVGILPAAYRAVSGDYPGSASTTGYGYQSANGNKYVLGTGSSYGATFTTGDVIGVALDLDGGTLVFYKNGSSQGTAASSISGTFVPGIAVYNSTGASTVANCNFGQRPFAYTAPSGFKALCTQNLPTPTIGATATTQAGKYFNPVLYTGNGNATAQAITGVGFQPDFVWLKARSQTYEHILSDAVRGAGKILYSSLTNAEATVSNFVSFDSDGFTVNAAGGASSFNANGVTYASWNWKANGAGSSNTSGTITSTVSANTTAGFSIVTATAQSSGVGTFGHGLGVAPSMVIIKGRGSASSWGVYHVSTGNGGYLLLNSTSAFTTDLNFMNNTSPSSTVFTLGASYAGYGTFVTYCFAPVAGYSAFGSFTGNGSTDGPMVYTGFRPRWLLIRGTGSANWCLIDTARSTYNITAATLFADQSQAEAADLILDINSNGFKIRNTFGNYNTSSATYIYAAFAEVPFKYALAR